MSNILKINEYLVVENEIEYLVIENIYKNKYWYYKGMLHRKCGPAVEWLNGSEWWYKHGKLHREDGPAIIQKWNKKEEYYLDDMRYEDIAAIHEKIIRDIIE